jgi:hypothetical protein
LKTAEQPKERPADYRDESLPQVAMLTLVGGAVRDGSTVAASRGSMLVRSVAQRVAVDVTCKRAQLRAFWPSSVEMELDSRDR